MPDRPIYLDYQATTPLDPRVADAMAPYWSERFGNAHSRNHRFGWEAREAVETARCQVAELIGADDDEIVFVSGATESCNLAIRGLARAARERRHIVTVATEHPAVLDTAESLEEDGFDIEILPVMGDGLLDLRALEGALTERTLLASVMLANNEIGVVQPVREIAELCHSVGAAAHTDATQAIGRMGVDVEDLGVDLLSLSGHKFYGPNGIGALYVRQDVRARLSPILTGGAQEGAMRPGTVATPLAVGLGAASDIARVEWPAEARRLADLTGRVGAAIRNALPSMRSFGHPTRRIPGNLSIGFPGISADRVVAAVADRLAISTGAACSSGDPGPSHVLLALGCGGELAASGIRISLGRFTTPAEVDMAGDMLHDAVKAANWGRI